MGRDFDCARVHGAHSMPSGHKVLTEHFSTQLFMCRGAKNEKKGEDSFPENSFTTFFFLPFGNSVLEALNWFWQDVFVFEIFLCLRSCIYFFRVLEMTVPLYFQDTGYHVGRFAPNEIRCQFGYPSFRFNRTAPLGGEKCIPLRC